MTANKKQIQWNIAAFLLLFLVSLYRQISLRMLPNDPFRTYILFACYIFLIGIWVVSVGMRVTQKSMRNFLMLEAAVMLTGLTIRFLQDTFWFENILLMRVSGLYICATILPGLALSIYASLGIGQWDHFKIPGKWYLLFIPVMIMTYLCVTDEERQFMFYLVPGEAQPNLNFHPNIGTFLLVTFAIVLMIVRVAVIYRRNRKIVERRFLRWVISLFEPILVLIFSFGFFVSSLQIIPELAGVEVIELFAKMYYIEVLTWEFYMYTGLVPVNTQYSAIFEHADVGMQIIGDDGYRLLSRTASEVSPEQFAQLKDKGCITIEPGRELHMHRFADGLLLWNKDVSQIQSTIHALNQSVETLAQEGGLLNEELKTKNQEASLMAKNQIYDELTNEVKGQLRLMRELTKKRYADQNSNELLRKLCLLGTYVKRRCNLRLIQKETGSISEDDLRLSFQDMVSAMNLVGIHSELQWHLERQVSAEFSIYLFDVLENLLEYERFAAGEVLICVKHGRMCLAVKGASMNNPDVFIRSIDGKGYAISCQNTEHGYEILLAEGGE